MGKITHHQWSECSYNSLPQWVKRSSSGIEKLLRGKSFFYLCQQVFNFPAFYYRKLRYQSGNRCKYLEEADGPRYECIADAESGTNVDMDRLREDMMRTQGWLDCRAFQLTNPYTDEEIGNGYCGNRCPLYKP